jgi:hypothetical protein
MSGGRASLLGTWEPMNPISVGLLLKRRRQRRSGIEGRSWISVAKANFRSLSKSLSDSVINYVLVDGGVNSTMSGLHSPAQRAVSRSRFSSVMMLATDQPVPMRQGETATAFSCVL